MGKRERLERYDLLFDLFAKKATNDEIEKALQILRTRQSIRTGVDSQNRADRYLMHVHGVVDAYPSLPDEDHGGVDRWLVLNIPGLPRILPAQIKSSMAGVEGFRESESYHDLHKAVFVLCAGEHTSRTDFRKQFASEKQRILRVISNGHKN